MDRELLQDIADRARRTETRVTKIANHLGVNAGESKPVFDPGARIVTIAHRKTAFDQILDAIPASFVKPVVVVCDKKVMAVVTFAPRSD